MTKINIQVPDALHKKLKIEALKRDKTLKELVIELLGGKV